MPDAPERLVRVFEDLTDKEAVLVEQYNGTLAPLSKEVVKEYPRAVLDMAAENQYGGYSDEQMQDLGTGIIEKGKLWLILNGPTKPKLFKSQDSQVTLTYA